MIMEKSQIGNYLLVIALMLFCGFIGSEIQKRYKDTKEVIKYIRTIEKQTDTVYQERIVYEEKIKEKEKQREKLKEKEKEIVYDEEECKEIVDNLKEQLANCDTIVEYKDVIIRKTDTIVMFKDKIIDQLVVPKKKPFGIGVQVGATTDLQEVKPYIGIGISYNLIRF